MQKKDAELLETLYKTMDAKFAEDLVILGLEGITTIADYFIISTATSNSHMMALSESIQEVLKKNDYPLSHTEGLGTGRWVLLDYGSIIIHIFDKESREYYNLERIWRDGQVISF